MTATLVIEPKTWAARNPQANVTGVLYLKTQAGDFPDAEWSDFPIIVLGWWLGGLADLAQGVTASYEALFMDGPFSFTVHLPDTSSAALVLHTPNGNTTTAIDFQAFYACVIAAAEQAVQTCQRHGWSNSDLAQLQTALGRSRL